MRSCSVSVEAYEKGLRAKEEGQSIEDNPYTPSWADSFAVPMSKQQAWELGFSNMPYDATFLPV